MVGVTSLLAALFSLYSIFVRPGFALGVVIISMLVWPEYLRMPVGVVQMSIPRVIAFILIVKLLFNGRGKKITLNRVDLSIFICWVWVIAASFIGGADSGEISRQIGRGLDTVLIYMATRLAIKDTRDIAGLFIPCAFLALFMGVMGVVEAVTFYSPYQKLEVYRAWVWFDKPPEYRLGLLRAKASTEVHIYFGLSMAMLTGILWSVRGYAKSKSLLIVSVISGALGTFSSMSSGPWIAFLAFLGFNAFAFKTSLIKPLIWFIIFVCIGVELASNRHFYSLVGYIALSAGTAWYRVRLMEIAFDNLDEFWLYGVAGNWPHHWGALLDGRGHIDVVNHFLIMGLYGGILAMFLYIYSHYAAIKMSVKFWKRSNVISDRKAIFTLVSLLLGIDVASMSVGLFGPPLMLSFVVLGLIVSVSTFPSQDLKAKSKKNRASNRPLSS
ncbi:hypothetical protein [Sneathiella limimaris]|uniref:hypothetical protein n=1 Tax=Sneathiella limimaris TaxID=1964213 RepID=UPI00146E9B82|nr:hypothetical protein [Sneathiella limimaris]